MTTTFDRDALPETCHEEGHVPGCAGRAGGDHELEFRRSATTFPLSMLRCSECGNLLTVDGRCETHGLLDPTGWEKRDAG